MKLRDRLSFHQRHYLPLYALIAVVVVVIAAFPSGVPGTDAHRGAGPAAPAVGSPAAQAAARPGRARDPSPAGEASSVPRGPGRATTGPTAPPELPGDGLTGKTRGGFACREGVRQIPWSAYAAECLPRFTGDNGGPTYRGVTDTTIKFVVRRLPGDTAIGPISSASGFGTPEDWDEARKALVPYFNGTFELYGRKVIIEYFDGKGNVFDEINEKGKQAACEDAKEIATSRNAFGVLTWGPAGTSGPFSECAAKEGLFVPYGAQWYPESSYRDWHPYVWGQLAAADDMGHDAAEYIGKRLANRKARWAGDEESPGQGFRNRKRSFGMFVPAAPSYRTLGDIIVNDGVRKWNYTITSRFDYESDPASMGRAVNDAIAQFKNAGVTSIILASEFAAMKLLTRRAAAQDYFPEWVLVGMGWTDMESSARECDQRAVDGHLFGMSQFGGPKMYDPKGEVFRTWRTVAPGRTAPDFMPFMYFHLVDIFNKLQLAGPNLTPQNIAAGIRGYTGGSKHGAMGHWSYAKRHVAISDAREIFWDGGATGFDGKAGAYVETYRGRRFDRGEWTRESPPIYPRP